MKSSKYLEEKIPLMLAAIESGDERKAQCLAETVTDEARAINPRFYKAGSR